MRERARVQELHHRSRRRSARLRRRHVQRHAPRRALLERALAETKARAEVVGARGEDEPVRPQARRALAAADGHGNVRAEGGGCLVLVVVVAGVVAAALLLGLAFLGFAVAAVAAVAAAAAAAAEHDDTIVHFDAQLESKFSAELSDLKTALDSSTMQANETNKRCDDLCRERDDLLVLLANMEIENAALVEELHRIGGEEAIDAAKAAAEAALEAAIARSKAVIMKE